MKLKVTVAERPAFGRLVHRVRDVVPSVLRADRLLHELEAEAVSASERAVDPENRRDALERAVRLVWGATL